ncbi:MAG: SDR family NAD(P)-dependent oxidoreductase [Bacteroidales bacterium]
MKNIVIVGGTSGIGFETALLFLKKGYTVGIAGRRAELLEPLVKMYPQSCLAKAIDINSDDSGDMLKAFIEELGGMDIYLHAAGIGYNNPKLDYVKEINTAKTNCVGFTRMITVAYSYLGSHGGGQIAIISSIAGVKGIGTAPAYSATKRFQNTYIDALSQLSRMEKANIYFTDIRPGFVDTPLLKQGSYPMLMKPDFVAGKIFKAIIDKKRNIIIDWRYRLMVYGWRIIPEWLWERLSIKSKKQ